MLVNDGVLLCAVSRKLPENYLIKPYIDGKFSDMIRKRGMLKNVEIEGEFSDTIKKGRAVSVKTARHGLGAVD